jgi:hypothetical protein
LLILNQIENDNLIKKSTTPPPQSPSQIINLSPKSQQQSSSSSNTTPLIIYDNEILNVNNETHQYINQIQSRQLTDTTNKQQQQQKIATTAYLYPINLIQNNLITTTTTTSTLPTIINTDNQQFDFAKLNYPNKINDNLYINTGNVYPSNNNNNNNSWSVSSLNQVNY